MRVGELLSILDAIGYNTKVNNDLPDHDVVHIQPIRHQMSNGFTPSNDREKNSAVKSEKCVIS